MEKNQLLNRCKRLIWKSRCHYYYYKASALNNFSQFYPELVRNEVEIISRNHKFAIHIAFVIWWIIGKIMRNVSSHFTFNFIFTYSHGNNGGFCYNLKTDTFLFSFFCADQKCKQHEKQISWTYVNSKQQHILCHKEPFYSIRFICFQLASTHHTHTPSPWLLTK